MGQLRILAFSGSVRSGSYNRMLIRLAAEAARYRGAEVSLIELSDFSMPIYHGDLEDSEGLPDAAIRLKKLMIEHDAFLIASPEYNSSLTPLLVNALSWVSRSESANERPCMVFKGKIIGLLGASPGGYGAQGSLASLRSMMVSVGATVLTEQVSIPKADKAFDTAGKLINPSHCLSIETLADALMK